VISGRVDLHSNGTRRNLLDGLENYARFTEQDGRVHGGGEGRARLAQALREVDGRCARQGDRHDFSRTRARR